MTSVDARVLPGESPDLRALAAVLAADRDARRRETRGAPGRPYRGRYRDVWSPDVVWSEVTPDGHTVERRGAWVPTDERVPELPNWRRVERRLAERDALAHMLAQRPNPPTRTRPWDARDSRGWQYRNGSRTRANPPSDMLLTRTVDLSDNRTW